ncbi:MAG TPA: M64 family metallopeptidase [Thermoanaerobaculia bacterium]|nr:M64 family metallopeptidase [Thermoanaerobaculia bacterium]
MLIRLLGLFLATAAVAQQPPGFDARFTGKTLRFDYFHGGTAKEEHVSLDGIRLEGDWPGSRVHLLDGTNLGKYLFEVIDPATNQAIWSRGFSSIYGEWETTGEAAAGTWRTIHESMRFPETRGKAQLVLKKRTPDGSFREIFSTVIDPASRFVDRSPVSATGKVWAAFESGPPAVKVDLLFLGDGYAASEMEKFHADVRRLTDALFAVEPFKSRRNDFNVRAIDLPSSASGVTDPRTGTWRKTPLGLAYNAFDSERYMLTFSDQAIREAAAQAPYDALILLSNSRKYGGGGIFNLWNTAAVDSAESAYLVVHEFGHSFAGLGDEYYTSQVAYEDFNPPGTEPWEPNVTALLDPEHPKWGNLVAKGTPIPTPWNQDTYDKTVLAFEKRRRELREKNAPEEQMEALFEEVRQKTTPMLRAEKHFGKVGAFQGASYEAKGLYRPEVDCIMFSRNPKTFCDVCAGAIDRVIGMYAE